VTKIEQLERELNQKINELNESSNALYFLHKSLISSAKTLREVKNLLEVIKANLKDSNEYTYKLEQENWKLKLSCDQWMKRAIKLEFKVLSARDATKE
jgi:hypothetical protein